MEVDISNIWCSVTLQNLLECEGEVARAHEALADSCQGKFLPWLAEETLWKTELQQVEKKAARLSEHSKYLVVVGNDSATSGLKALACQLGLDEKKEGLELLFAGSDFSTPKWQNLVKLLEHADFSVHFISQLGDNLETSVAVRSLRWLLTRRYGAEVAKEHIFVTTDKTRGKLRELSNEEGYTTFEMPRSVAAHHSVLSPGGLFALAAMGVDLRPFFSGATEAVAQMNIRSFENPAWLYAGSRLVLGRKGKVADCLCLSNPEDKLLGHWWKRLFASRMGECALLPMTVQCPDEIQDSQAILAGGTVMETVLRFEPKGEKVLVEMDWNDLDGLRDLEGVTLETIQSQATETVVQWAEEQGTPLVLVDCGTVTLENLGQMMYFFELSACLYGDMTGWKPYGARIHQDFQPMLRQNLQK